MRVLIYFTYSVYHNLYGCRIVNKKTECPSGFTLFIYTFYHKPLYKSSIFVLTNPLCLCYSVEQLSIGKTNISK